jgi:hypothetical protein
MANQLVFSKMIHWIHGSSFVTAEDGITGKVDIAGC